MFQFDSLAAFIAMDGHGVYVWACYAFTLAVLAWLVASPLLRARQIMQSLHGQEAIARKQKAGRRNSASQIADE
jgi:heme exporter protein D